MVSGVSSIDVEDWRRNTRLKACSSQSPVVQWFWRDLEWFWRVTGWFSTDLQWFWRVILGWKVIRSFSRDLQWFWRAVTVFWGSFGGSSGTSSGLEGRDNV